MDVPVPGDAHVAGGYRGGDQKTVPDPLQPSLFSACRERARPSFAVSGAPEQALQIHWPKSASKRDFLVVTKTRANWALNARLNRDGVHVTKIYDVVTVPANNV